MPACMPSLERVASRAAPSLTVRVASVLYVHACVLMRTCVAAKDRQTEWQRGGSAGKTCSELRFHMCLKLRLSLCVQAQRRFHDSCLVEIKLVLQPECARLDAALHLRVYAWVCAKQGRWEKIARAQLLLKERSFHRAKANVMMGSCRLQSWLLSAAASDIK